MLWRRATGAYPAPACRFSAPPARCRGTSPRSARGLPIRELLPSMVLTRYPPISLALSTGSMLPRTWFPPLLVVPLRGVKVLPETGRVGGDAETSRRWGGPHHGRRAIHH